MVYGLPGGKFWQSSMNKYFVIGFVYHLTPHRHWRVRGTPKVVGMGRILYFLIWKSPGDAGSFLFQLLLLPKRVASMSGLLKRGLILS